MADAADTALILNGILLWIVVMVILYRSIITIAPGQEGLVYYMGKYRRTLQPGFNVIHPLGQVVKVAYGSSDKIQLGAIAIVDVPTDYESYRGRIRVGKTVIAARSQGTLSAGTRVRVITTPRTIDFVEVVPDDSTSVSRPLRT